VWVQLLQVVPVAAVGDVAVLLIDSANGVFVCCQSFCLQKGEKIIICFGFRYSKGGL
jgi:hypothetical protein